MKLISRNSKIVSIFLSIVLGLHFSVTAMANESSGDSHEAEKHEEGAAALSPEQIKKAGIETEQVSSARIRETLPLYGVIEPNGENTQHIGARFAGVIRSVSKKLGDSVRKDEVLATIEGNESLRTYPVTSSIDGVVAERNANPGEHTADSPLFVVTDLSTVWVNVAIFPRDHSKVHVGQEVRITNTGNHESAIGKIVAVSAIGNANQTLTARVLLENPERKWIPGVFVNAEVTLDTVQVALAIRNEAIQNHEGKSVVFVKGSKGFEPRPVELGRTDGEMTEVSAGINQGETYVTKNSFIVKADLGKDGAEHE